jgi:hypothetical protein
MCCNSNLFYVSYYNFLYNYFLKSFVHKINFKIIKSRTVKLAEREKTNVANTKLNIIG